MRSISLIINAVVCRTTEHWTFWTFCCGHLLWAFVPSSVPLLTPLDWAYLVQRVSVGFVVDAQVIFQLAERPHACPAVLLTNRQQQRGDRVVELRNRHWVPGAQEDNVCSNTHTIISLSYSLQHSSLMSRQLHQFIPSCKFKLKT